MAGTTTQWILELVDKITGPAQSASSTSRHLTVNVDKVNDKLDKTSNSSKRAGESLETFGRRMMYLNQISDVVGKTTNGCDSMIDRKSTRPNSSHENSSRMPSSAGKKKYPGTTLV